MSNFPTLPNPSEIEEIAVLETVRTEFEGGYLQTRAKYTRDRKKFRLRWGVMSDVNKTTLTDFFETTVDGMEDTFTWTHPSTAIAYTVRFAKNAFVRELVLPDKWTIEIELEEI